MIGLYILKTYLTMESSIDQIHLNDICGELNVHDSDCLAFQSNDHIDLNAPFTVEEVCLCIHKLPNSKAPGHDGLMNEMLKSSAGFMAPYMTALFNRILDQANSKNSWEKL